MRAVVVYESMYGNTRSVAEAIGEGLRRMYDVAVVPVGQAGPEVIDGVALLVVGGPTHVHGMTRPRSREAAVEVARKPEGTVVLEEGTGGPLRRALGGEPRELPRNEGELSRERREGAGPLLGRGARRRDRGLTQGGRCRWAQISTGGVTRRAR